jgi:cobalt-zinc-cadmium efflux system membrane fusion protein
MRDRRATEFVLTLCIAATLLCSGCGGSQTQATKAPAEEKEAPAPTPPPSQEGVRLSKDKLGNITTAKLVEEGVPVVLNTTGKVQFNEDRTARILAPVSGRVGELAVQVGDPIREGQTLFFLQSREAASAISDWQQSIKDKDLAEKTFQMTTDLYEHQAASRIALQQAESDLAKSRAAVARNEESLRVLQLEPGDADGTSSVEPRIPIRSPLAGTVIERTVTNGQFVQPDPNPLLTIADLSSVWVLADVFEQDLHRIRQNQMAMVTTAAYPDDRFSARVARISDVVDPSTHTVKVRFLASNTGGRLKPEMFANVTLFLNEMEKGLMLPMETVFVQQGRSYVFVQGSSGEFLKRQVEVTPDGGKKLRVVRGLQPGEVVVTDGAMLLTQAGDTENQ